MRAQQEVRQPPPAMKNPSRCLVIFAAALLACGGGETTEPAPPPPPAPVPTSVQLSTATVTLRIGETSQLAATVLDQHGAAMAGQTVAWASSDTTKITVTTAGLTRGVRPGTATITASSGTLTKSAAGTVLTPQLVVEAGASVTKSIGVAGGTISTQAASGAKFTLTVPPTALSGTIDVTLTPIATIQNVPTGTTVVAAVRMRPDGLSFLSPASLTMEMPTAASSTDLVGLRFADDGTALHLVPVRRSGSSLTIPISHFSGAGAANTANPPLIPLNGSGTIAGDALSQLMLQELNAQSSGNYDVASITGILLTWYTSSVKPLLVNAATDEPGLLGAIGAWAQWRNTIISFAPSIAGALDAATSTQQSEARSLAATALQAAIQRNNAACTAQLDLAGARKALQWQGVAEYHALATLANALDRSSVLNGLCVKVGYGPITFPDSIVPMQPADLRVQTGLRFGSGPLLFFANPSVDVAVSAIGSTDGSTRHFQTNATGIAQTSVTPTGAGPLNIALHSCINDAVGGLVSIVGLTLLDVCRDTTVSRNLNPVEVYQTSFGGTIDAVWSHPTGETSPSGQRYLGKFANEAVRLSLANLPTHSKVIVEMDLYIVDSWDGSNTTKPGNGPDIVTITVGDSTVLHSTFSNVNGVADHRQSYPDRYPGPLHDAATGAISKNTLGYTEGSNNHNRDSIYRFRFEVNHSQGSIILHVKGTNITPPPDEWWGLDNIRVTVR
jgi:hypothetical protein